MRIWLAPSAFYPQRGGVEELTLKLAQHLTARGHHVIVIVNRHPANLPANDLVESIPVRRIRMLAPAASVTSIAQFATHWPTIQAELAREPMQPDVIHIQCPSVQTLPLTIYARRRDIPLVLTSQGEVVMDANQVYQHSLYMRSALRVAARSAEVLTACSSWTAQRASELARPFHNALPILNGIDVEDWPVSEAPSRPILCAWGRHVPQKGFDLLLTAFARLRQSVPDASLLLGGDGPETEALASIATPGVEMLGSLDRTAVATMLGRSRVAVVPSRVEPFGIVALEALAAGRNLVYSVHGGLAEAAGGRGWAVDPFDVPRFAETLEAALAADVDVRANRRRAEMLSWSSITSQYEAVYRQVAPAA